MLVHSLFVFSAYLLGSVPWGLFIAKKACGIDPRTAGSRSIGATNISRLCGFGYGCATLLCDILKGTLPVYAALAFDPDPFFVSLVAFCAVLGHVFSCFLGFRGGKAVATTIGVFLPLAFYPLLAASILCLILIAVSGFVSVGSLTLVSSLPLFLAFSGDISWLALSVALALLVFWKHRENLSRLHEGTEKPFLKRKVRP
ncbi:MAG: glycerol-3-phosphate 1-O-acyltransferase PlsY [Desulfovibrionaceae bacterium]|nr:glycerol-3-phosphate 1-O-acyltransferase PlsY [Desulfovibrionaceae bacterium]